MPTEDYIANVIKREARKRHNFHIRARKAALTRWGRPVASMDDAQASATSIDKHAENTLGRLREWIAKAQIRKERARLAAQARWSKKQHAASIEKSAPRARVEEIYRVVERVFKELESAISPLTPHQDPLNAPGALKLVRRTLEELSARENHSAAANKRVAGHQGSFWSDFKKPSNRPNVNSRYEEFKAELIRYWLALNKQEPEYPWIDEDGKVLWRFLKGSPSLNVEVLRQWLLNRCDSERVNHSEPFRIWLRDVVKYSGGPLDQYQKPLRR